MMKRAWLYGGIFLVIGIILIVSLNSFKSSKHEKNPFLAGVIGSQEAQSPAPVETAGFHYIEITDGCNWAFEGTCVNMRSGPGTSYPVMLRLRIGMVLKVEAVTTHGDEHEWYKIVFDGDIRYPERIKGDWYVAADSEAVRPFTDIGEVKYEAGKKYPTSKRIVVNLKEETLYAYDGDTLFMQERISSGIELNPTEPGTFSIFKKTPSRYMQGPLPGTSDEYYDLPGVPWDLYFTADGAVLHGAYWHDSFGEPRSHGCINQSPQNAKKLYEWAEIGTPVTVVAE